MAVTCRHSSMYPKAGIRAKRKLAQCPAISTSTPQFSAPWPTRQPAAPTHLSVADPPLVPRPAAYRNLCASTFALDKIKSGPVALASSRLLVAEQLHVLSTEVIFTTETELFLAGGGLKSDTANMGSEIACAATFGVDLYVTWDWQRLEAQRLPFLHLMFEQAGLPQMDFISPLQLVENDYETLQTSKGR